MLNPSSADNTIDADCWSGNIGFAATQGMADDIGLVSNQLNVRPPEFLLQEPPGSQTSDSHFHLLHTIHISGGKVRLLLFWICC
jgi:hypothetical protein